MATYGYVRVSTAEQAGDDRTSLDSQAKRVEALAVASDNPIDRMFIEAGVSGGIPLMHRPEGAKLWALLQPGDRLIAAKLDRLFRNAADALMTAEALAKRKVGLVILDMGTEPVTDSGVARFFFGMLALVAEFERSTIKARQKEGQAARRRNGGNPGGKRPLGYKVEGQGRTSRLVPDPLEQVVIAEAVKMHGEGKSLRAIRDAVNKQYGVTASHSTIGLAIKRAQAEAA